MLCPLSSALEMLDNYRVGVFRLSNQTATYRLQRPAQILNLTGFQKALKKFEKVTKVHLFTSLPAYLCLNLGIKIPALQAYLQEKVGYIGYG